MRFQLMPLICCLALIASTAVSNASDGVKNSDGAGDSVGQKIDRGLQQIGNELRQGWAGFRNAADRMGVQARVLRPAALGQGRQRRDPRRGGSAAGRGSA